MGSCVSLNKGSESAVKLRLGSRKEKLEIPSPVKETVGEVDRAAATDAAPKPQFSSVRFAGSRDEAFFDSQPWLESDYEDDYYSVNGDFTPSRGSTPIHHSFASPRAHKPAVAEKKPESPPHEDSPSPTTGQKKRLSELFQDSLRMAHQMPVEDQNIAEKGTRSESAAANSEGTDLNGTIVAVDDDDHVDKSLQCCVPGLLGNRSLSGRKKKATMSPVGPSAG